ncbi:hypothetical protein ACQP2F_21850 [Actinoplanes sp. CA-030573]|uniref:hypothetical protein n=1 Tax=Actinoplanes sp. CA-030573 TaxID=3239898 RepID=UPI003D8B2002
MFGTEEDLSAALGYLAADRPFAPDFDRVEKRARQLRRRRVAARLAGGAGVLAVVAAAGLAVGGGSGAPGEEPAAARPSVTVPGSDGPATPLLQLVDYLAAERRPAGDATLIRRDQRLADGRRVRVFDLFADNGDYYFAGTRGALPARVKAHRTEGGDLYRRELAAARFAATGDLHIARQRMASAPDPAAAVDPIGPGVTPGDPGPAVTPGDPGPGATSGDPAGAAARKPGGRHPVNRTDNWVWGNSLDALCAGAGDPMVRAGVLRLLSTMPEVTVGRGAAGDRATLTLTAGAPAFAPGTTESLTLDASTGEPIRFVGHGVTITYTVTRVRLDRVARGNP